jgi:branched-chain amino acid transport system substrate-binding protein
MSSTFTRTLIPVGLALALFVAACAREAAPGGTPSPGTPSPQPTGEVLTLGVMGPMTGDYASYGTDWQRATDLAVKEINAAGGCNGNTFETVPADDRADPKEGVSAANQLVAQGIFALIGPIFSGVSLPVTEITERATVPTFIASSNPQITERGFRTVFRMAFRDDQAGPFDANTALTVMGAKTAVVIHDNSAFAKGLADAFVGAFEKGGGKVLSVEVITPGEKDYTPTLTKVKGLNPDVVYYSGYFPEGGLLVKQGKELGIEKPGPGTGWLFGNSNYDPTFIKIAGQAAEGILMGTWPSPETDPNMADYLNAYQAEYNMAPGTLGHWGYDAVYVLCEAIKRSGTTDRETIVQTIHAPDFSYQGVSGEIKFDEKGDRTFPPLDVLTVEDGKFTVYQG